MARRPFRPVKLGDPGSPKAAVARLFDQAGGAERVAVTIGRSQSQTYAYADPDLRDEIAFASVCALTGSAAPAAAEYLAQLAGGVFLPVPSSATPIGALTAETMRAYGEAAADLIGKLADGSFTAAEAKGALEPLDRALRDLAQLRQAVAGVGKG
jgi:hypothetical protein